MIDFFEELRSKVPWIVLGAIPVLLLVGFLLRWFGSKHDIELWWITKYIANVFYLLVVKIINDVVWAQNLVYIWIVQNLHFWSKTNAIIYSIDLVLELELHFT